MWKISFSMLILLNSFIGGLLFWQWDTYSENIAAAMSTSTERATQHITVKATDNKVQITQTLHELDSDKEYRINMPQAIKEWTCVRADGSACASKDDNPSSFLADNESLTITYQIPLGSTEAFLLNEWLGVFPDLSITKTAIEIVDYDRRTGSWAAGLDLKGHNKFELIDYYSFEGSDANPSLYWQPKPLQHKKELQDLNYYATEDSVIENMTFDSISRLIDFTGVSIIFSNEYPEMIGNGLMVVKPTIEKEIVERKIVYHYLYGKTTDLPLEETYLIDVLTSLLVGQDSKIAKGTAILHELKTKFSEEELKELTHAIMKESKITAEKLDEVLGSLKNRNTHFFSLNKNEESSFIPLYFTDNRKIYMNDRFQKDLEIIMIDNKRYYPFVSTFEALGFDVKALGDNETILLQKGSNSYRFFISQNIFIYNEEDYGLLENPLHSINGTVYVEENWLNNIFHIDIDENDNNIRLSSDF